MTKMRKCTYYYLIYAICSIDRSFKCGSHCLGQHRIEPFFPHRCSVDGPQGLQGWDKGSTSSSQLHLLLSGLCSPCMELENDSSPFWWLIPAIPTLRKLREEACQIFSTNPGYTAKFQVKSGLECQTFPLKHNNNNHSTSSTGLCFKTGVLCVVLAIPELILQNRLASDSEILLPQTPKC